MKGYSKFSIIIRLFSVISGHSLGGVLPLCRGAVGVFYSPSRLGNYSNDFTRRMQRELVILTCGNVFLCSPSSLQSPSPVGWGCIIHRMHLCRWVRPSPHSSTSVMDMTLNNLMLELWRMQSTPSLPSLPGLLWSGVVAPNRVLSIS